MNLTRLRLACATALTGLIAAVLAFPICNAAYWRDDRHLAADPNVSRLVQAIMEADGRQARRLLDLCGTDLNALDARGIPPLAHAIAVHGHPGGESLAQLLIDHGADVNRADSFGHTPLMWDASFGDANLTEVLLREGADVRARRPDGTSVLHVAVHSEADPDVVRLLLAAGAEPAARDREGKTPADYARAAGLTQLVKLLDAATPQITATHQLHPAARRNGRF